MYSFGVLLLELVTARRAIKDGMRLVDWAQKYMDNESKIALIVDSDLENAYSLHEVKTLISIIKRCTQVHFFTIVHRTLDTKRFTPHTNTRRTQDTKPWLKILFNTRYSEGLFNM